MNMCKNQSSISIPKLWPSDRKNIKDIDNIDIGWNIDISISKMLISVYHIKNVDTVKNIESYEK